jgi:hypothetical protein
MLTMISLRVALGALGLCAMFAVSAQEAPRPNPDTFVCRSLPRPETRIKERVCGPPLQVTRLERDRKELLARSGNLVAPSNGNAWGGNSLE